jgi:glycine cleavage system H protein
MSLPNDLRYSTDHEWVRVEGNSVRLGITEYAQDALGDIVFVQLPELGSAVQAGTSFTEIESTKSVSDIYSPVGGVITERNETLHDAPELINSDPYGAGWLCVVEMDDPSQVELLMSPAEYALVIG